MPHDKARFTIIPRSHRVKSNRVNDIVNGRLHWTSTCVSSIILLAVVALARRDSIFAYNLKCTFWWFPLRKHSFYFRRSSLSLDSDISQVDGFVQARDEAVAARAAVGVQQSAPWVREQAVPGLSCLLCPCDD
jgi:hypothetical protein